MQRYSAHLPLQHIGSHGQRRIMRSKVALIGLGGLGCSAAQMLVSSGIGALCMFDFDKVSESNLARQVLYRQSDIGRLKTSAASEYLHALNPDTRLQAFDFRVDDEKLLSQLPDVDLVIDASDNYGTRLAVNRVCLALKKPWIMASCIRQEGQVMFLRPDLDASACYRCAYGSAPDTLEDCPGAGVFAPVAAITGASAAHFALAFLAGQQPPQGLHLFDAVNWQWQTLKIPKNSHCKDC
jgi:molybdopterin/thiamine biosynthesis adenylyltransferase